MLDVIPKYPKSIHRSKVFEKIEAELRKEEIEIPAKLEETVQSVYNLHCEGYSAFRKKPPGTKPYFKSEGNPKGYWSEHPDSDFKMLALDDF